MAVAVPSIVLPGIIVSYNIASTSSDPGYVGIPLSFSCTIQQIGPQGTSYPDTNYNQYTVNNITAGFKFATKAGKTYDVVSITVTGGDSATVVLRDTNLKIFTNSPDQSNDPPTVIMVTSVF